VKQGVLVDTGPLVAFLNRRDRFHEWTATQWNQIAPPMFLLTEINQAGRLWKFGMGRF
jgi:hypothetical protein